MMGWFTFLLGPGLGAFKRGGLGDSRRSPGEPPLAGDTWGGELDVLALGGVEVGLFSFLEVLIVVLAQQGVCFISVARCINLGYLLGSCFIWVTRCLTLGCSLGSLWVCFLVGAFVDPFPKIAYA